MQQYYVYLLSLHQLFSWLLYILTQLMPITLLYQAYNRQMGRQRFAFIGLGLVRPPVNRSRLTFVSDGVDRCDCNYYNSYIHYFNISFPTPGASYKTYQKQ